MMSCPFFLRMAAIGLLIATFTDCSPGRPYIHLVVRPDTIQIDGRIDEGEWAQAERISTFVSPWEKRAQPQTVCWLQVSREYLYFSFQVEDTDIVSSTFFAELDVAKGDRVELFFAADTSLTNYYCLEIGPDNRILDYQASFYRQFDENWDMPGLKTAVKRIPDGYAVEGSIPVRTLQQTGLIGHGPVSRFYLGIYRAEYYKGAGSAPEVQWISWIDPQTSEPDFHVPSSFAPVCITGLPDAGR